MLKDRLLLGVNSRKIQRALLAEKKLTLTKALEICLSLEAADKNAKILAQASRSEGGLPSPHRMAHFRNKKSTSRPKPCFTGNCFCCGKAGHKRAICRFKDVVCYGCGKTGHLKRVCKKPIGRNQKPPSAKPLHLLDEERSDNSESTHRAQAPTIVDAHRNQRHSDAFRNRHRRLIDANIRTYPARLLASASANSK